MAKVIDITDKLKFGENPKLKIGKVEIEVNADAPTMLKLMGLLKDNGEPEPKDIPMMYELMFTEKERQKLDKMHLGFEDFQTLIECAMGLITGESEQGE